jgi:hypothetical protein
MVVSSELKSRDMDMDKGHGHEHCHGCGYGHCDRRSLIVNFLTEQTLMVKSIQFFKSRTRYILKTSYCTAESVNFQQCYPKAEIVQL